MLYSNFFLVNHGNIIQELTYYLGQVITKPNNMQNYRSENSNFFFQTGRHKIPDQKVAGNPRIQPAF
jgi:hypothetical protein